MISSFGEARSLAIYYIGISHKSSGRVSDYLNRKEVLEEVSGQVVSSLIEDGYIDDLRIARSIIYSRKGRKAEGKSEMLSLMESKLKKS